MELAERFFVRFGGLSRAYGRYNLQPHQLNGNHEGTKIEGGARTIHEPLTIDVWTKHLTGAFGIGVVPIRDDSTAVFGAIDVDQYGTNLADLAAEVARLNLPLVLCRTKSGGAHLYLFLRDQPVKAEVVRGKLMEWAVLLGYSGVEVFPKQTRLAGPNDTGNWINMPYFRGADTNRFAILPDGTELRQPVEFLDHVEANIAIDAKDLIEMSAAEDPEIGDMLDQSPPCIKCLAARGTVPEFRNNSMFNFAVYLRKRFGDNWKDKMDEYNQKFMDPPLGHKELGHIISSASKKDYQYRCQDNPIVSLCNRQICYTMKYGVGTADGDPGVQFGQLVKIDTEPPTWIWDVNGERIECTTADLRDQNRFQTRCMERLNVWPRSMKPRQWADLVRNKLIDVKIEEAPGDASPEGVMWAMLQDYCTGYGLARERDELLLNKPWTDAEDTKRVYFNGNAFITWAKKQGVTFDSRKVWSWLRSRGDEFTQHHFFRLKGKGINVWSVPLFEMQAEGFNVPVVKEEVEVM